MSIFRRVSLLGFALVSLVALAACGGNGDGDGGGEAFERPAPGEYVFDVEATIEFTLTEPAVSAAAGVLQTYTGMGTGTATVNVTEPPEGGDGEVITGYFGGMKFELTIRGGDSEFPIEIIQLPDEDSSEWRMSRGTSAVPSVLTELGPFIVVVTIPEGDTLTNVDSVPLESNEGIDLTEAFNLRMPGLIPNLHPIRLQDEDEMVIGAITGVLLELTPTNNQVETGGDGEPEPPDDESTPTLTPNLSSDTEPKVAINDASGDAYKCADGEDAVVVDLAVDMLFGGVTQLPDGVVVRVSLGVRPIESAKDASFAVQAQIGQEGRSQVAQYEFSGGQPNNGRLDDAGNVIPGSEGDVTATGVELTFTFPGLVLKKGDTVTVRSSHQRNPEDAVNCDVTDAFPLDELVP